MFYRLRFSGWGAGAAPRGPCRRRGCRARRRVSASACRRGASECLDVCGTGEGACAVVGVLEATPGATLEILSLALGCAAVVACDGHGFLLCVVRRYAPRSRTMVGAACPRPG